MSDGLKFFVIFFALLIFLLLLLTLLIFEMKKEQSNESDVASVVSDEQKRIEDVLNEYNIELLNQEENTLYINSKEDLYSSTGSSNKELFDMVIKGLIQYFEPENFSLVDNNKKFKINIIYDYKEKDYNIIFNDIEGFYSKTDGKTYIAIDNTKISKRSNIYINNNYLETLFINNLYFSSIKDYLGDGKESKNNYTDYLDGTISVRLAPNKIVKNIVFKKGYKEGNITDGFTVGDSLNDICSKYSTPAFGNEKSDYIGYLNNYFYFFYYKDEISIYPYSYKDNSIFEELLSKYIEDNDLNMFIKNLTTKMKNYDYLDYDEENETVYLLYANKGIEINIKNNDSKGIVLYNNYHYTDTTKKYIKNGFISLNSDEDLVNETEIKRRNNTLNFK